VYFILQVYFETRALYSPVRKLFEDLIERRDETRSFSKPSGRYT